MKRLLVLLLLLPGCVTVKLAEHSYACIRYNAAQQYFTDPILAYTAREAWYIDRAAHPDDMVVDCHRLND